LKFSLSLSLSLSHSHCFSCSARGLALSFRHIFVRCFVLSASLFRLCLSVFCLFPCQLLNEFEPCVLSVDCQRTRPQCKGLCRRFSSGSADWTDVF
jgi:hypothetical protein